MHQGLWDESEINIFTKMAKNKQSDLKSQTLNMT